MKKSLYATLGVAPNASLDDIRQAYESRLASVGAQDDILRMAIKEAWNVLGHAQRRAVYDASLLAAASTSETTRSTRNGAARAARRSSAAAPDTAEGASRKLIWLAAGILLMGAGWWMMRPGKKPPARPASTVQVAQVAQVVATATSPLPATPPPVAPATPAVSAEPVAVPSGRALSAEELFAQAANSVVRINVVRPDGRPMGHGSGVVIDKDIVITNCHVANAGGQLRVLHQSQTLDATVLISDEAHDLCKLSVTGLDAPAAPMGRGSQMHVGQKVYAIGSPQGLDLTLSDGMVSSLRQTDEGPLIQTTTPVSPGSSGGGLFNEQGALVGIVTFQMRSGQNLNFAVPSDWIEQMRNTRSPAPFASRSPTPDRVASADPQETLILGTWHCFGPLTGRGLDVTLAAQGRASGQFDGHPITGTYMLQNRQLSLMGHVFMVEELSPTRMVLSKGEGRRLACSH